MSRFYGSLKGSAKTTVTRRGHASSGLEAHVRGWDIGVRAECAAIGGKDAIYLYTTGGSNEPERRDLIATITLYAGKVVVQHAVKEGDSTTFTRIKKSS